MDTFFFFFFSFFFLDVHREYGWKFRRKETYFCNFFRIPPPLPVSSRSQHIFHYYSDKLIFSCTASGSSSTPRKEDAVLLRAIYTIYGQGVAASLSLRGLHPSIFVLPYTVLFLASRCKGNLKSCPRPLMNPLCPDIVLVRGKRAD